MHQCGKLVTMGHGDHAKCGEDYWGKFFQCVECQLKDLKCPDAQAVNVAESSSPMPGLSPKQEQEDFLTRLDRIEMRIDQMMDRLSIMLTLQDKIIEALAEDQDPDEMPATYMDGSPI
jgi:hypothetical protein